MKREHVLYWLVVAFAGCIPRGPVLDPLPEPIVPNWPPPREEPRSKPVPASTPQRPSQALSNATVIIDAGHGGKDPGTHPKGVSRRPEKEIVLAIANLVAEDLTARGINVVRTRVGDTYPTLEERAALADRHKASLLVSIHADSAPRKSASGSTIYIARNALPASRRAAQQLGASLRGAGIKFRGIRRQNFVVLVRHSRPAVLVECGYLSNAGDARRLNTPGYRARVASALADGIASYCGN